MSIEYCDRCKIDVVATHTYIAPEGYQWRCPICRKIFSIGYDEVKR